MERKFASAEKILKFEEWNLFYGGKQGRLFGYKVVFTVPSIELHIQSKMFF